MEVGKALQRTVPREHHSKEGLSLVGGKKGKTVYDDSWLHDDLEEQQETYITNHINKLSRSKSLNKSLPALLIKGTRTLNTSKLVKRRVPVRGKNGKIFYRMQWIDPNDQVSEESNKSPDLEPIQQPKKVVSEKPESPVQKEKLLVMEAPKTSYDLSTQEGQINKYVSDLSREEKQKLLDKYKIEWQHHPHPMKDWMNAVMALKQFMQENPHLAGLEHLPKGGEEKTLDGTTKNQDFLNNIPRDKLYSLCKQAGIADEDPATNQKYIDNGTAAIRHLNNMGKLRQYLQDNPHLLDLMRTPGTKVPGSQPTSSKKSTAQKGGNTISGILKSMSSEDLYKLMKEHGIADEDPRLIPGLQSKKEGGNGTAPIKHMHNMMKLKALIEKDPSILNFADVDKTELSTDEKDRLAGMDDKQKQLNEVKDFLAKASKDTKKRMIESLAKQPLIANRKTYENENKDWMESMIALRKVFEQNPELMKDYQKLVDNDELRNLKITNHQMEKILRRIVGVKGEYAEVRQVERGVEWNFGNFDNPSFARIEENDDGDMILSVVNTGEDGEDWVQNDYPLKHIKDFLEDLKDSSQVDKKEIPVHERNIKEIEKAVQQSMGNLTPEVMKRLKPHIAAAWVAGGKSSNIEDLTQQMHKMGKGTVSNVLRKMGVPIQDTGDNFDIYSDAWKNIAYGELIDSTKTKNATDYLYDSDGEIIMDSDGRPDPWVLIESAKNWSAEERTQARTDLARHSIVISDTDLGDKTTHVKNRLSHHIKNSTEYIPFDLCATLFAKGLKFQFKDKDASGNKFIGNHFNPGTNTVCMNHFYLNDAKGMNNNSTFRYVPEPQSGVVPSSFIKTASHEVAHALDYMFSGYSGFCNWEGNPLAEKYVGKAHINCIQKSYSEAVQRSNPNKELIAGGSDIQSYYFHKDEWISVYEGRVYGVNNSNVTKNSEGKILDNSFSERNELGVEHWSMNVERYAEAFSAFKEYASSGEYGGETLKEWAEDSYKGFKDKSYGTDFEVSAGKATKPVGVKIRRAIPERTSGFFYHAMGKYNKSLNSAINNIFDRSDFIDKKDKENKPSSLYNKGDFTRKSVSLIIKL